MKFLFLIIVLSFNSFAASNLEMLISQCGKMDEHTSIIEDSLKQNKQLYDQYSKEFDEIDSKGKTIEEGKVWDEALADEVVKRKTNLLKAKMIMVEVEYFQYLTELHVEICKNIKNQFSSTSTSKEKSCKKIYNENKKILRKRGRFAKQRMKKKEKLENEIEKFTKKMAISRQESGESKIVMIKDDKLKDKLIKLKKNFIKDSRKVKVKVSDSILNFEKNKKYKKQDKEDSFKYCIALEKLDY